MRFKLGQLVLVDQSQAFDLVRFASLLKRPESLELPLVRGDDHLSDLPVRDLVLLAKLHHGGAALDAVPRLERTGPVVDAGVDDSAVVAGLLLGDVAALFEDGDLEGGVAS